MPLAPSHTSASPAGKATLTVRAAKGTFPVGSMPMIEVVLKATGGALMNIEVGKLKASGGQVTNSLYGGEVAVLPKHGSEVFTAQVSATKAGVVPLTVTFTARTKAGKKVTIKGSGSLTFG